MTWTNWTPISQRPQDQNPAIYQVRLLIDGLPRPIPRFLDVDDDCILLIGESVCMGGRFRNLTGAMGCGQGSHSEGNLWYFVDKFSRIRQNLGSPSLEYRFRSMATKTDAKTAQDAMLKDYLIRFGELPPLNSAIHDRHDESTWKLIAQKQTGESHDADRSSVDAGIANVPSE